MCFQISAGNERDVASRLFYSTIRRSRLKKFPVHAGFAGASGRRCLDRADLGFLYESPLAS